MGDAENAFAPSKKRAAGRELSRDNPGLDDEEDTSEQETGSFKRASDEVLATRRIVKVRRNQNTPGPTSSSNPFAGIRLVPPTGATPTPAIPAAEVQAGTEKLASEDAVESNDVSNEAGEGKGESRSLSESKTNEPAAEHASDKEVAKPTTDEPADKPAKEEKSNAAELTKSEVDIEKVAENNKTSKDADKEDNNSEASKPEMDNKEPAGENKTQDEDKKNNNSTSTDQGAESAPLNSFQQLSSSQNAFSGFAGTGFPTHTFSFGSIGKDGSSFGAGSGGFLGLSNNGTSSLFGTSAASVVSKNEGGGFPPLQEVQVETGEENEKVIFSADSVLFEFLDGSWKERGKGELKVNVATTGTEKARLVMRARGNYRLILNASLFPEMKLTNMDKKGITFACVNSVSDGKDGLSTFALKFKDGSMVEEFRAAVMEHKDKAATAVKTPENSPKVDG